MEVYIIIGAAGVILSLVIWKRVEDVRTEYLKMKYGCLSYVIYALLFLLGVAALYIMVREGII